MVNKSSLHNLLFNLIKLLALIIVPISLLAGCGAEGDTHSLSKKYAKKEIILTTGFEPLEVFRMENVSCMLPEVLVYLTTAQNRYESVYGPEIWNVETDGVSMADSVKDNALADISQIKAMNLLAEQEGISLPQEDDLKAKTNAEEYYESLSEHEKNFLKVDEELLYKMYYEYALAHKVYFEIIKGINPEISDDEARTITVQHVLIKTYTTDSAGRMVQLSDNAVDECKKRAEEAYIKAKRPDVDFEDIVLEYSEGDTEDLSFGKGTMDSTFEETAFNLGKGEISPIIRTPYGFHIIKCINTFNRTETDLNKVRIAQKRREMVFSDHYDNFAKTLRTYLNDELWDSICIEYDEEVNTQNFFEIYNKNND